MERDADTRSGRLEQAVVLAGLALALIGMSAFVLAPRSGEPVTLLPLSQAAEKTLSPLLAGPDTALLARGAIEGSYIVRGHRPGFAEGLFQHGVLILNASAPGCGPTPSGLIA